MIMTFHVKSIGADISNTSPACTWYRIDPKIPSTAHLYHRDALSKLATVSFYVRVGLFIILLVCLCFSSVMWLHTISGNQCEITRNKRQLYLFFQNYQRCGSLVRSDEEPLTDMASDPSLPLTCFRVRSISMPWFHGAAGLARQSPAFPLREMSTFCLRRFLKASAITITPSYVRAEVYWDTAGRRGGEEEEEWAKFQERKPKPSVGGSFTCCYDFL